MIDIAFLLEPQVDEFLVEYQEKDAARYCAEHEQNDQFYDEVVQSDLQKFEEHYAVWKESVVRFHKLKQEDAIQKFLARMESSEFVNPPSRVQIFKEFKDEQKQIFELRLSLLQAVEVVRPTMLTEAFVNSLLEKMEQYNNESSLVFDSLVDKLVKDIENTNEDIGLAEYDL